MRGRRGYDEAAWRRLEAAGCPVDPPPSWGGVRLRPEGGPGESLIFAADPIICYVLCLVLDVRHSFVVERFELELPWEPREFQWLEPADGHYRFPGDVFPLPNENVLNALAERNALLRAPQRRWGWLLGQSRGPLPKGRGPGLVDAKVRLRDTGGHAAFCWCPLLLGEVPGQGAPAPRRRPAPPERMATRLGGAVRLSAGALKGK